MQSRPLRRSAVDGILHEADDEFRDETDRVHCILQATNERK